MMSKQWFNSVLEHNPVPTIWISNNVEGIDPAFLRRFTYAVEMRALGARQRGRILARHLGAGSSLTPGDIAAVAERFPVSPAQLGNAVKAGRMLAQGGTPDRATLEKLLAPVEKLVAGVDRSRRAVFDAGAYRVDALNSPDDLAGIADRLAGWAPLDDDSPGISLCLHGPPGTGKSEFVKYLAHRMDRPIVYRRVSDIQSMWVGESEKNIAAAFREAEDEHAVLLFDEADSFLRDRRGAARSWEVSQVNEFLQQLESSRGVVACTTNLWRDLDEASLRRFVFKIELRCLRPEQALALFHASFGALLPAPLAVDGEQAADLQRAFERMASLTPGDFAAVGRRVRALGQRPTAPELLALLRSEVAARREAPRPLGF